MLTDEEIEGFGQKYQGKVTNHSASMPNDVYRDIQVLLSEINSLHIKLEAMEIERSHYFKTANETLNKHLDKLKSL